MKSFFALPATPQELFNHTSLSYFAHSKFFAVLYNEKGQPVETINQGDHTYNIFLEYLSQNSVFENYQVPRVENLGGLFDSTIDFTPLTAQTEWASGAVRHYPSRNVFESLSEVASFLIRRPLTNLALIRLTPSRFLGIVSLNELFYRMSAFADTVAILTDRESRIVGFSNQFGDLLPDPGLVNTLPGKGLTEILSLSESGAARVTAPSRRPSRFSPVCDWLAGRDAVDSVFTFLANSADCSIEETDSGLVWKNGSRKEYGYLVLKAPLNTDECHFNLDMRFSSPGENMPNIIFRGLHINPLPYSFINTPDVYGFNFSAVIQSGQSRYFLKKCGKPVFVMNRNPLQPGTEVKVRIEKRNLDYAFFADDLLMGRWSDTHPARVRSDGVVCLFLRPQQTVTLKSFRLEKAAWDEAQAVRARGARLTARMKGPDHELHFNVNRIPCVWDGENFDIHLLDDITRLQDDIDHLEQERSTLVSLLKQDQGFIGRSARMLEIRNSLPAVARSNLAVLIEGETGCGKEVLARALHQQSARKERPFVKIDLSALPPTLMESELFGHEKGAFTGAVSASPGRLEQAQGGTVFLDEIGNLSLPVQAKLLSVLQDFAIQRLGGTRVIPLDVRLICATNVPLKKLLDTGRFREDLSYRINQVRFTLPPLRERKEDIPLLADEFRREANVLYDKQVEAFSAEAVEVLAKSPWYGNIRELKNAVLRSVLFSKGAVLSAGDLEMDEPERAGRKGPLTAEKRALRRKRLKMTEPEFRALLSENRGNIVGLAKSLGVGRPLIYKWLREWQLKLDDFRPRRG